MIRQINVKENPSPPAVSKSGGRTTVSPDDLSVAYRATDTRPLFTDLKIKPGLLPTVSDRARSRESRTVHETESERSLADIALSVGYSDQANFTTAFRRQFGKIPLTVRHAGKGR